MKIHADINDTLHRDGSDAVRDRHDRAKPFNGSGTTTAVAPPGIDTGSGRGVEPAAEGLIFKRMSDVEPQPVQWLWPNRLALCKQTLLAGEPGVGKSQIALDVAARVSTGAAWPDGAIGECGSVVILSAEDAADDTIRPRLEGANADLSRIHVLAATMDNGRHRTFNLQTDLEHLGEEVTALGDVRLVIIDPVTSYMGKIDSHRTTDVRAVLEPLGEFASRHNVAVLVISHPPKNASPNALHFVTGSLAFVAAARLVFIAIDDPETEGRQLLLAVKNNLGAKADGLGYRREQRCISKGIVASYIIWDDKPVSMSANEALCETAERGKDGGAVGNAANFLRETLGSGPKPANDVKKHAEANGIALKTLERARKKLNVDSDKDGFQGQWIWRLPETTPNDAKAT